MRANMKSAIVLCIAFIALPTYSIPLYEDAENLWQYSGKFEGDMVFGPGQKNGIIGDKYRWPNREIPYEIGPEYSANEKRVIKSALTAYDATCLTVRERTADDTNYVYITSASAGCFSHVGKQGGKQVLNLNNRVCLHNRIIRHEFLHAVGFYHQQSVPNRDNYVTINWENIKDGQAFNFNKYNANQVTDFGLDYDYKSIMHYGRKTFSKNGLDTIVPTDANAQIGVSSVLSPIDIAKIKAMYNCP